MATSTPQPEVKSKQSKMWLEKYNKSYLLAEVAWIPWKGNRGPTLPKNQENERAFLRKMALGGI